MRYDGTDLLLSPSDIVSAGLCIGCGVCAAHDGGMNLDGFGQYKPRSDARLFQERTSSFSRTCPFSPAAENEDELAARLYPSAAHRSAGIGSYEAAYVGHVAEKNFRVCGSSGGMVSWVANELLSQGMVDGVAHVTGEEKPGGHPYFRYRISRAGAEVCAGAKSRYYPVELSEVLSEIRSVPGRYAVVGIPCFIKAVNLARANDRLLAERIVFTLGLFCGHMKSARFVESLAWQMRSDADEVESVEFRLKDPARPANWYTAQIEVRGGVTKRQDWWHLADGDWGAGFFQNSACNFCDDVVAETADISFGDAWLEPYSSDGRGTNVVVVRSHLLHLLLQRAIAERRLSLQDVDSDFVERTQAAGLRQRREGLSYRLTWRRTRLKPRKRVASSSDISLRRKITYRSRNAISFWSHRVFWLARKCRSPGLYVNWAHAALYTYHGVAYSRGFLGALLDRMETVSARKPTKPERLNPS